MQAGIPSISSKLPEYERLNAIYNCGLCIENNLYSLSEVILKLYVDKIAYKQMCENTILAKQKLNWQIENKKLIKLIQKL